MNSRARFRLNAKRTTTYHPPALAPAKALVSRSRSTTGGGTRGERRRREPGRSSAASTSTPKTLFDPSPTSLLASLGPTACPLHHTQGKNKKRGEKKKKNAFGDLPPAAHQGELLETASRRDSTDETPPNMSTFLFQCSRFFSSSCFFGDPVNRSVLKF